MSSAASISTAPTLPAEIVCQIIERTDDTLTLNNWCAATASTLLLNRVALRTRWASAEVTQDDFICPIDGFGASLLQSSGSLIYKTVYVDDSLPKPLPASYIRQLILNFYFRKPDQVVDQNGYQTHVYEQFPTSEALQMSLAMLLPHCISLEEIYHEGVLHQENLDEVTKLAQTPLRSLRLRMRPPLYHCRWLSPHPPYGILRDGRDERYIHIDFDHYSLRWQNLSLLKGLRRLDVCRVWHGEGASLAKAIAELHQLEILAVVAAFPTLGEMSDVVEGSALNEFLTHLFPINDTETEPGCKLPKRLRSLVVSDFYNRNISTPKRARSVTRSLFPYLTDLYLDLEDVSALTNIIDWLDLPVLSQLTLSVPCAVTDARHFGNWHEPYAAITQLMQSVIWKHTNTLRQITLLNAWQDNTSLRGYGRYPLQELNANWDSTFTPQELVLGTTPPSNLIEYRYYPSDSPDGRTELRDYCNFIITLIRQNYYGSSLRRLRIDQINFYEDVLDDFFAHLSCDNITVLMLYPWPRATNHSDFQLPCDLKMFKEGQVAMTVVSHGLPELRVLVIGGYHFWIDRSPPKTREPNAALSPSFPGLRLWHLSLAEQDPDQSIAIKRWLTRRDRYFMSDLPPHPRLQDSWARSYWEDESNNCLLIRDPCLQMRKHRNYTVLHRQDGADHLVPPSERPPTQWLADLATWDQILGE